MALTQSNGSMEQVSQTHFESGNDAEMEAVFTLENSISATADLRAFASQTLTPTRICSDPLYLRPSSERKEFSVC